MRVRIGVAIALLVVALAAAGCVREPLPDGWRVDLGNEISDSASGASTSGGNVNRAQETFELNGATNAVIDLTMGAGEMTVRSGDSSAIAETSFDYGVPAMRPETSYAVSGSTGTLKISQPDVRYKFGVSYPNSWDVRLAKAVPLELHVQMGAGSSRLNLSELDVRSLTMRLGAGESTVDLTGSRAEDLTGDIQAGVGQLTIVLPSDVGVKVTGRKEGIGTFEADGFKVQGDSYVNDAYGTSATNIELNVMRGVGEVKLELQ
jgi:N-terminal domain of toast_rack, DUF2154